MLAQGNHDHNESESNATEADIETLVTSVESDYNAFKQELTEKGVYVAPPQGGNGPKDDKTVTEDVKSYLEEKFPTEKIGTGEGAQAFGWGLYFTDLESIADTYAKKLSDKILTYNGKKLNLPQQAIDDIAYELDMYDKGVFTGGRPLMDDFLERIRFNTRWYDRIVDELDGKDLNKLISKSSGVKYKVSLHKGKQPSEYTWLEWDKPLNEKQKESILSQA